MFFLEYVILGQVPLNLKHAQIYTQGAHQTRVRTYRMAGT